MAKAIEELVSRDSFGALLVRMTRERRRASRGSATGAMDLVVRNLRLAGRRRRHAPRAAARAHRGQAGAGPAGGRAARRAARGPEPRGRSRTRPRTAAPSPAAPPRRAPDRDGADAGPIARAPVAAVEFANILLTTRDAQIGATPKDVVWTHRTTTLYRYRSNRAHDAVPVLLVFALINRPDIFDLRPGNSFVEFLLDEGYDVFLVDWGVPGRGGRRHRPGQLRVRRAALGDARDAARRRPGGADAAGLVHRRHAGAMYSALDPASPVRNLVLLTTPVDTSGSLYAQVGRGDRTSTPTASPTRSGSSPARASTSANKMMKPVTNYWTTYRRLWGQVLEGTARREAYQTMAQVGGRQPAVRRPRVPRVDQVDVQGEPAGRGRAAPARQRVDLRNIEQNLLVVTAGADHIAPRAGTLPLLDLVSSADVEHLDRPGGHIGLMAGSRARNGHLARDRRVARRALGLLSARGERREGP